MANECLGDVGSLADSLPGSKSPNMGNVGFRERSVVSDAVVVDGCSVRRNHCHIADLAKHV
jgi:hypothetical protein